jgi:hypothetical protein
MTTQFKFLAAVRFLVKPKQELQLASLFNLLEPMSPTSTDLVKIFDFAL